MTFEFAENPYFNNKVLVKTYEIPNLFLNDEPVIEKVTTTKIDWKAGMCLTFKEVTKKQRARGGPSKMLGGNRGQYS